MLRVISHPAARLDGGINELLSVLQAADLVRQRGRATSSAAMKRQGGTGGSLLPSQDRTVRSHSLHPLGVVAGNTHPAQDAAHVRRRNDADQYAVGEDQGAPLGALA
jgi:hypothetical protein